MGERYEDRHRELREAASPGPWRSWIEGEGDAWGGSPLVLGANGEALIEDIRETEVRLVVFESRTSPLVDDLVAELRQQLGTIFGYLQSARVNALREKLAALDEAASRG